MERTFDELRKYTTGLTDYLKKLEAIPLTDAETTREMHRSIKLLTEYLHNTIDSVERHVENMTEQIADLAQDNQNYSNRSVLLISDIKRISKKLEEFDELKNSVDNLTDIILRNLKQMPTSGDEYVEESTEESYKTYMQTFTMKTQQGVEEFDIPEHFKGRIFLNGTEVDNGKIMIIVEPPGLKDGYKTYRIYGSFIPGDVIEFIGVLKEG